MSNKYGNFDFDDLQRELDVTESYLNADNVESQTLLRRSLTNIRSSQEKFNPTVPSNLTDQSQAPDVSIERNRRREREIDSVTADDVIRNAQSTIPAADLVSNNTSQIVRSSSGVSSSSVEGNASISRDAEGSGESNRYSDPKDRDALIQRLLSDYNTRKAKMSSYLGESEDTPPQPSNTQSIPSRIPETVTDTSSANTIKFTNSQRQYPDSRIERSPLPPLHPLTVPNSVQSTMSNNNKLQNSSTKEHYYSIDNADVMSTPSFYNGSSAHSSPLDTDATPTSNQGSGKKDELFYASDLYGEQDVSMAYMGGGDDLFDRMHSPHFADNTQGAPSMNFPHQGSSPTPPFNQRYNRIDEVPEDEPIDLSKTMKFMSSRSTLPVSSMPQSVTTAGDIHRSSIEGKNVVGIQDYSNNFSQTVKMTKEPQPWERAMPDYQFQNTQQQQQSQSQQQSYHAQQSFEGNTEISRQVPQIYHHDSGELLEEQKYPVKSSFLDNATDTISEYFQHDERSLSNPGARDGRYDPFFQSHFEDDHQKVTTLNPNNRAPSKLSSDDNVFDYTTLFKPPLSSGAARRPTAMNNRGRSKTRSMSPSKTKTVDKRRPSSTSRSVSREPRATARPSGSSPSKAIWRRSVSATRHRASSIERDREYLKSKEQLQKEAEEEFQKNHTFTPQLSHRGFGQDDKSMIQSRQRSRDISQRIQEMQEEHKRKIEARERMRQEYEKIDNLECTFQPSLCKTTKRIIQAKERQQQQQHALHSSLRIGSNREDSGYNGSVDISQRLHEDAAHRVYYHHWLGQELEKIKLSEYTFTPTINNNTNIILEEGGYDMRPIHERVVELQRQHRQRLQSIRNCIEREQVDLTFQPKIVDNSRLLAERRWLREQGVDPSSSADKMSGTEEALRVLSRRDEENNVATRLLNEGRRIAKRKHLLLHEREQELAEELEQPVISKGSQKLAEQSEFVRVDFETRQRLHESRVNRRYDERQRMDEEMFKTWFQPEVSKKTHKILSEKRPDIMHEDAKSRSQRMAYEEMSKIENHRKELEKEIYQQVTFEPEIDPISKLFGRKSTIQELYENPRGKQRLEQVRQRLEQEINEACTFTPKLNQKSRQLAEPDEYEQLYLRYQQDLHQRGYMENDMNASNQSQQAVNTSKNRISRINMKEPEKMAEDIKLKALQKEEARRNDLIMKELRELEECTFHPNLYSYPPAYQPEKPIVVKGLARHMELRQLSNKMKEEAALREYEVFHVSNVEKFRRPEDGLTMVEPFEFRHQQMQAQRR